MAFQNSKMIFIAHRGCTHGPSNKENDPSFVNGALSLGFDVEIDVWKINDIYFLGHDKPTYEVDLEFLERPHLWCHAKNIDAISSLSINYKVHSFYHNEDDCVLTSRRYIWTYPGKQLAFNNSIAVLPERMKDWDLSKASGICSDYISQYKEKYVE